MIEKICSEIFKKISENYKILFMKMINFLLKKLDLLLMIYQKHFI